MHIFHFLCILFGYREEIPCAMDAEQKYFKTGDSLLSFCICFVAVLYHCSRVSAVYRHIIHMISVHI